jgi:surface-anchored protein
MKMKTHNSIGRIRQLGLAALLATGLASQAQTPVNQGHTDIGLAYDGLLNAWDLHVHHEPTDTEYEPADALLFVKYEAHGFVPVGAQWSFLGTTGSEVWTLPKVEDPLLLFLGFGAEEIGSGVFVGDTLNIALKNITGPGHLAVYDTDAFGDPIVWMNSRDGFDSADSRAVPAGLHQDLNWAFSAPGDYSVFFEASGISTANGATASGDAEYRFHVQAVPEPGTLALFGVAAAVLTFLRRR